MKTRRIAIALLALLALPLPRARAEDWDARLRAAGYVDLQLLIPSLRVELKYATADNFMGRPVYDGLTRAFLHPDAARKLRRAHELLRLERPDLTLLVYDAARPIAVQRIMWNLVRGTPSAYYVANPTRGGLHNFGLAVDLTLADTLGRPLPMGTPFDHFGPEAHLGKEQERARAGIFAPDVPANRALMRRILSAVGLRPYDKEWWHYQERMSMPEVRRRYRLLDF